MPQLHILGISDQGLDSLAPPQRALLDAASLVAGGERHVAFCAGLPAEKVLIKSDLKALVRRLEQALADPAARPVVLASGDPLFYGIAAYLITALGAERVTVHPALGSMQLAFARAGMKWDDAALISVHGRPLSQLGRLAPDALKVGVFTDPDNTPAKVAAYLMDLGWPAEALAVVVERLEAPSERLTRTTLGELARLDFDALNVVLVERPADPGLRQAFVLGLEDEAFVQRKPDKGLITKAEVRVLSLSKLRLFPGATAWDIGAATGSVSIEAARCTRGGRVWAVEKNADDCENVRENVRRFSTPSVQVLHGEAPAALAQIPATDDPDAVFVGGTSGKMDAILDACLSRLKSGGSLVLNTVTLENGAEALDWFSRSGLEWNFLQVQVSRGRAIKTPSQSLHRLEALNPVTVFWGLKTPPKAPSDAHDGRALSRSEAP